MKQLDVCFLEKFINEQVCCNNDKNDIIEKLGKIKRAIRGNTYLLTPYDKNLENISLSFEMDKLESMTIYAKFDFCIPNFVEKYGLYREVFNNYDDVYIYFFNEKNESTYYIKFTSHSKYDLKSVNEETIKSIEIIFKNSPSL